MATAGKLIDPGDIKNGSIKEKDIQTKAKKKFRSNQSVLVSSIPFLGSGSTQYVAPGMSQSNGLPTPEVASMVVPDYPAKGFNVRGLAFRNVDSKSGVRTQWQRPAFP